MNVPAPDRLQAAVRTSRATLLSYLASRAGGDLAAAEDALSDALLAAMRQWSEQGIPDKPEAWLLAIAKRRLIDGQRRQLTRDRYSSSLQNALEMAESAAETDNDFPDERLKLLFVCAHPAIDEAARTPLMLQTVLGLDAQVIASAFLVAPSAMAQRLVRAKAKIKAAAIPFKIPEATDWPERITFVLDAVYAAFNRGWQSGPDDAPGLEVATEALRLGDVLETLVPDEPEVLGLQSLMLHCQARRPARGDANGQYIPLDEQDCALWDHQMIDHAESLLERAGRHGKPGRFQIEAAIQSAHAHRRVTGVTEWRIITALYELLMTLSPALGARIGHAISAGRAAGPEQGLRCLDDLPHERLNDHQPYWAARARLLADAGHREAARAAYSKAIGLSDDPAVREYLLRQSRKADAI